MGNCCSSPDDTSVSEDKNTFFSDVGGSYSYVGKAAVGSLRGKHAVYENSLWRLSSGTVPVAGIIQSPPACFFLNEKIEPDIETTHSDFFPAACCDIISKAEKYVDIVTLSPPNGKFSLSIAKSLKALHDKNKPITVRVLFGNIITRYNLAAICSELTDNKEYYIPRETKLSVYVGSYNIGFSWNHCKIIAVDGKYLMQGGHNLWDADYCAKDPIRDLSMEAEGAVAHDGHVFANRLWKFMKRKESETRLKRMAPDFLPILDESCCEIFSWPQSKRDDTTPEPYDGPVPGVQDGDVPMISCGRLAAIHGEDDLKNPPETFNPSDSALLAMIGAAKKSLKFSIQDIGPLCKDLPGIGLWSPYPWPKPFLRELGLAMYQRGVDVEIILSGPNCRGYGYGWDCSQCAAEIVKAIKELPDVSDERIRAMLESNLRLCYMRSSHGPSDYPGKPCGNHAKAFIVDDMAYYIGSQNMYVCDLAEWGLIVDDEKATEKLLAAYWEPAWKASYEPNRDCKLDHIFEKLQVSKMPPDIAELSAEDREAFYLAEEALGIRSKRITKNLMLWVKRTERMKKAQDVYLKVRIVNAKGETKGSFRSTTCFSGDKNPVWNEQFTFWDLVDPSSMSLVINIFDEENVLGLGGIWLDDLWADEKLGVAKISLGSLKKSAEFQEHELSIEGGSFAQASLVLALNTGNSWGQE